MFQITRFSTGWEGLGSVSYIQGTLPPRPLSINRKRVKRRKGTLAATRIPFLLP